MAKTISEFIIERSADADGFSLKDHYDLLDQDFLNSQGLTFHVSEKFAQQISHCAKDLYLSKSELKNLIQFAENFHSYPEEDTQHYLSAQEVRDQFKGLIASENTVALKAWHRWYASKNFPNTSQQEGWISSAFLPEAMVIQGISFPSGTHLSFEGGRLWQAELFEPMQIQGIDFPVGSLLFFLEDGRISRTSLWEATGIGIPFYTHMGIGIYMKNDERILPGIDYPGVLDNFIVSTEGEPFPADALQVDLLMDPTSENFIGVRVLPGTQVQFYYDDAHCMVGMDMSDVRSPSKAYGQISSTSVAVDPVCLAQKLEGGQDLIAAIQAARLTEAVSFFREAAQKIYEMPVDVWHQDLEVSNAIRSLARAMRESHIGDPKIVDLLLKRARKIPITGKISADVDSEHKMFGVSTEVRNKVRALSAIARIPLEEEPDFPLLNTRTKIFEEAMRMARHAHRTYKGLDLNTDEELILDLVAAGRKDLAFKHVDSFGKDKDGIWQKRYLLSKIARKTQDLALFERAFAVGENPEVMSDWMIEDMALAGFFAAAREKLSVMNDLERREHTRIRIDEIERGELLPYQED